MSADRSTSTGRALRVLLVSHRFAGPQAGGTEVLTHDLATALTGRGHDVTVLAGGAPPVESGASPYRRIGIPARFDAAFPKRWQAQEAAAAGAAGARIRASAGFDVMHVTHFARVGLAITEVETLRKLPAVVTLTDYTAVCPDFQLYRRARAEDCRPGAPSRDCLECLDLPDDAELDVSSWRQRNLTWLNTRAQAIWVQTPHQARQLAAAGVDATRIVQDRACYGVPSQWPAARHTDTPPALLYVGRISPEKGLHVLLTAFSSWQGQCPLRIVGPVDDPAYATELRHRTRHDRRVIWMGAQDRSTVGALIAESLAVLVPSQWQENDPIVAHEALALGVPVYCSDVTSMRHRSGNAGLILVPEPQEPSSWRRALDTAREGDRGRRMSRLDQARAAFDSFVDSTVAVYRRAAAGR